MVPFVDAFSASCSTKPSVAPRPAVSEGSIAATVSRGAAAADTPGATPISESVMAAPAAATIVRRVALAPRERLRSARCWAIDLSLSSRGAVAGAWRPRRHRRLAGVTEAWRQSTTVDSNPQYIAEILQEIDYLDGGPADSA